MTTPSLDSVARATLIDNLLQKLHDHYIFPEVARQMDATIRAKAGSGAYNDLTTLEDLCERLTEDLQQDALRTAQILALRYVLEQAGDHPAGPLADLVEEARAELAALESEGSA